MLNFTIKRCLSAANCSYTSATLPVAEACEAMHIADCLVREFVLNVIFSRTIVRFSMKTC